MSLPARNNFDRSAIAQAALRFGAQVGPLPPGITGEQLLWALCGVESSFGANCQPRHEPAFDVGGRYATHAPMPTLLARYGPAAACSYGPLQLMLCNAPPTYGPASFDDLTLAMQASVNFLNQKLRQWQPASLAQIGECWNAGRITPDPGYEAKLATAYAVPLPAPAAANV